MIWMRFDLSVLLSSRVWSALGVGFIALVFTIGASTCTARQPESDVADQLVNGNLEEIDADGLPTGWFFPSVLRDAGYDVAIDTISPLQGANSALIDGTKAKAEGSAFGNLMQTIDAEPYRGKRVRFRAAVRTDELGESGRAQLWLRVDRQSAGGGHATGAFDNMQDRPIRDSQWKHYEIVGEVADDAKQIIVGMLLLGKGKAWMDDAALEIVPDATPTTGANVFTRSRPIEERDPPEPFWTHWLWLPAIALALFGLSQSNLGLIQRIAFRFSFVYWLLYSFPAPIGQVVSNVGGNVAVLYWKVASQYEQLVNGLVQWTVKNVFGIHETLVTMSGSGDKIVDYIQIFLCFVLASLATIVWSAVDWRRTDYPWLNDLLRSYLRYVLAFTMLGYGLAKVGTVGNQFSPPGIEQLTKTYGESSPMNLVWTFMGASRAYTIFAGLGEVAAALLLVWRRTTILGAMVAFGVMLNVVMLNFCYDVPVKQYSTHLLVMAVYILLPETRRLANLLLWNRTAEPVELRPPYTGPRTIWIQRIVKAALILFGLGLPLYQKAYEEFRMAAGFVERPAEPAVLGVYEVESFLVDGQPLAAEEADARQWQLVSLRRAPFGQGDVVYIRMLNRTLVVSGITISSDEKILVLQSGAVGTVPGEMQIEMVDDSHLSLSGSANGQSIEAKLRKLRREDFLLVNRGYHWINEYPFNR